MVCGNENCIWRKNDDLQAWHCEYAYTCPYQTNKYKKYIVSDHTETYNTKITFSNNTEVKNE